MDLKRTAVFLPLAAALLMSGCGGGGGGSDSTAGNNPPAQAPGVDIALAEQINAEITGAMLGAASTVDFVLTDGDGQNITGLPADSISFTVAKLLPGTDGANTAWQSYINRIEQPGVGPGTEPKTQATTENGSAGNLAQNSDETYTYTFAADFTNVTDPVPVDWQPALTHRVSFEIRGFAPVANPSFDVRPSDGASSGLLSREVTDTASCNGCHENMAFHGGARREMQQCVTCHNPGSGDANSGNTVDMTVMTHKIHRGMDLPSVVAGEDYCLYGFNDNPNCYGDVAFSQDIRNCESCHDPDAPGNTQAANWYTVATAETCGSCHDDVDFVTGAGHGPGIPSNDTQCTSCHANNPDSVLETRQAHRILTQEGAARYSLNILGIDFPGPGSAPTATFSITDPQDDDRPYDLANDAQLATSTLRFFVAWNTVDYTNRDNGSGNAQPESTNVYEDGVLQATENGDYTYTLGLANVPDTATGTGVVAFEASVTSQAGNLPVTTSHEIFGITDDQANPVARRDKGSLDGCNDCHGRLSFHRSRNDNLQACAICHVPDAARRGDPSAGPMDMKHFLHRKHAVDDIRYPQRISNCLACHTDQGFYPVASDSGVLATSVNRGSDELDPTDNNRITANAAACSVCHSSDSARSHMEGRGSSFDACQEVDGTVRARVDVCGPGGDKSGAPAVENCTGCHGPGGRSDLAVVHGLQ